MVLLIRAALGLALSLLALPVFSQTADDFARWYHGFCAADPNTVSIVTTVFAALVSATGLGALASHSSFVRNVFGAKVAIPLFLVAALASCTAGELQQAQADIATGIQAACLDVNAVAALPGADPSLKAYAGASCGTAVAVSGLVQNSATLQWLGQLQGQLSTSTAKPAG